MSVKVLIHSGPSPTSLESHRYDHLVGLKPTALPAQVHHNLDLLGTGSRPLPEKVLTVLVASLGVWVADKLTPRHQAADAWTRCLEVHCPAPGWAKALRALSTILDFLTGDAWVLAARPSPAWLPMVLKPEGSWQPDCVCLFSGGLDSLAGAINLLEAGHRVLLVSHYDFGQLASTQNYLSEALRQAYGPERVRRWGFRVQFEAPELSLRSRSLLFLALGVAAASVWDAALPVFVPENGWISLNPPLTSSRLGSYSTRTTHPYFFGGFQHWLAGVGIPITLANPYQYHTKGELLAQCRRPDLLRRLAPATISCAHPVASRWLKGRQGNCGYCYPCLIRRAALHAVGWDDGREYQVDVCQQPEILASRARGADLRSLLYLLQDWAAHPSPHRLLWQTGPVPPEGCQHYTALLRHSLEEIRRWWQDQATPAAWQET